MRRELIAMCVGVCALMSAAVVGAQPGDEEPVQADVANIPTQVSQAKSLMNQIETLRQNANKAASEAQNSRSSTAMDCTREIVQMMAGPYKFAKASHASILDFADQPASQQIAQDIEQEYQRLATHFETMVTLHGKLQGCGGPTGGSVIDGAPLTEKQNDMKTMTDPTGAEKNGNNLNDLQVSAEASKGATVVSLDD